MEERFVRIKNKMRKFKRRSVSDHSKNGFLQEGFPFGLLWFYPEDSLGSETYEEHGFSRAWSAGPVPQIDLEVLISDSIRIEFDAEGAMAGVEVFRPLRSLVKKSIKHGISPYIKGTFRIAGGVQLEEEYGDIAFNLGAVYFDPEANLVWSGMPTDISYVVSRTTTMFLNQDSEISAVAVLVSADAGEMAYFKAKEGLTGIRCELDSEPRFISIGTIQETWIEPITSDSVRNQGAGRQVQVWPIGSFTVTFGKLVVFSFGTTGVLNQIWLGVPDRDTLIEEECPRALDRSARGTLVCYSPRNKGVGNNLSIPIEQVNIDYRAGVIWFGELLSGELTQVAEGVCVSLASDGAITGVSFTM